MAALRRKTSSNRKTSPNQRKPAVARASRTPRPATSDADASQLAAACVSARRELRRASRVLHDEVGSTLAAAGLRLQLLRMDHPDLGEHAELAARALDEVMESVRRLSRELDPSPAGRTGLKNAFLDLAERYMEHFEKGISVQCQVTATVPHAVLDALYLTAAGIVEEAASMQLRTLEISASGAKNVTVRLAYPHRGTSAPSLRAARLLAEAAGLEFVSEAKAGIAGTKSSGPKTEKSTIVLIKYAG